MKEDKNNVDFGHTRVKHSEKSGLVREVFSEVSDTYDLFNDVASLGFHRIWKKYAIWILNLKSGETLLDVASGSGDLAITATELVKPAGAVVMCDINDRMLEHGRSRCLDEGKIIEQNHSANFFRNPKTLRLKNFLSKLKVLNHND